MRKLGLVILLILIGLLPFGGVNAEEKQEIKETERQEKKTINHIIYITVEGLTEAGLKSGYTPNINGLAAGGIKSSAMGVLPANSAAVAASLLTGTDPSIHGVTEPGRQLKVRTLPDIIFGYGRKAVVVANPSLVPRELFSRGKAGGIRYLEVESKENQDIMSRAIDEFKAQKPFFLGIHLPGIQERQKVGAAVNSVDEQIGRMLTALRTEGVYEESLIVVAGYSKISPAKGEWPQNARDLSGPLVVKGPGVRSGSTLPPVKIIDIAPTTALLTGLTMPPETNGLVLWNALMPGVGYREENLLLKRVKDLSEESVKAKEEVYRLMEEKNLVNIQKEKINREKLLIHRTIENKDREISRLKLKINFLRSLEVVTILLLGAGYIVEYFYLKKKFLMF